MQIRPTHHCRQPSLASEHRISLRAYTTVGPDTTMDDAPARPASQRRLPQGLWSVQARSHMMSAQDRSALRAPDGATSAVIERITHPIPIAERHSGTTLSSLRIRLICIPEYAPDRSIMTQLAAGYRSANRLLRTPEANVLIFSRQIIGTR